MALSCAATEGAIATQITATSVRKLETRLIMLSTVSPRLWPAPADSANQMAQSLAPILRDSQPGVVDEVVDQDRVAASHLGPHAVHGVERVSTNRERVAGVGRKRQPFLCPVAATVTFVEYGSRVRDGVVARQVDLRGHSLAPRVSVNPD